MNYTKPVEICKNRKALFVIVKNEWERPAKILQAYLKKITEAEYEIHEVTSVLPSFVFVQKDLGADSFAYRIYDKDIMIEATNEQAAVYAVYDFLERVIGCRYYTSTEEYVPKDANLTVCFEDYTFKPILEYREVYYRDFSDKAFSEKHKMSPAGKHEGWGFWCHSFQTLVSPAEYFEEHPEYFSLYEGRRVGDHAQLCLSNPDVLDVVVKNLKKHIDAKPEALYWSVSQNDNNAYCQCEACQKMNEEDGTPMGSVLRFVNKVAEHFPDKMISTLAYWYTRKAPKVTKVADNVHIMLCNIEANRGVPIAVDPHKGSAENKQELLDWKERCDKLFLWDYCIQFRNLVSPFPNLRVLAPNIRFFVENNVRSLFSQSNRELGGEFSALRGYLLAKLMWDPYCDEKEVIRDFLTGYYKQAGTFIGRYIDLMHDALEETGGELNIFGGPLDVKETYFTEELFRQYMDLFDQAEEAVKHDAEALFRVKTARMPLYYAGVVAEYGTKEERRQMLAKFALQAKKTGLEKVEEWRITTDCFVTDKLAELAE